MKDSDAGTSADNPLSMDWSSVAVVLLLLALAGTTATLISPFEEPAAAVACPNCSVVLISLDALRADHLGAYGYNRNTSPAIDRVAADSFIFDNAIVQSTYTLPSHFSIFTSLYPFQHRNRGFSENVTMLAEALNAEGYHTFSVNGGGNVRGGLGFSAGFEEYNATEELTDDQFRKAFNHINTSIRRGEKFFLFYHTYYIHDPYIAPPAYASRFDVYNATFQQQAEDRWNTIYANLTDANVTGQKLTNTLYAQFREYYFDKLASDPKLVAHATAEYDGSIRRTDRFLQRLFRLLKQRNVYNNTVIILTADHGEEFGDHGGWLHRDVHREIRRVPLIIHVPNTDGRRIDQRVESIDLVPTIAEIVGVPRSRFAQTFSGTVLTPLMAGSDIQKGFTITQRNRKVAFINLSTDLAYYHNPTEDVEAVYNLSAGEENRLINGSLVNQLAAQYQRVRSNISGRTSQLEEKLTNLGYFQ
ncbi:MAG: sulfatase [Candidatus Nanohaloarchaeota archaeon QJJ-7]|nr:sulfatase [Candidatus Nanohaloarchaeota archaeon QJJ-7]